MLCRHSQCWWVFLFVEGTGMQVHVVILSTAGKTRCNTIAFLADALTGCIFSRVSFWRQWPIWIHRPNLAHAVAGLNLKPELGSKKQKIDLLTWLYLESCCSEYWESTKYCHRQNVSTQRISLNLLPFNINHSLLIQTLRKDRKTND